MENEKEEITLNINNINKSIKNSKLTLNKDTEIKRKQ